MEVSSDLQVFLRVPGAVSVIGKKFSAVVHSQWLYLVDPFQFLSESRPQINFYLFAQPLKGRSIPKCMLKEIFALRAILLPHFLGDCSPRSDGPECDPAFIFRH
jgi:hypothetical protein